ncbi:hypothetical protein LRS05_16160 [Flavobacterium sp. J372]|uniref:phosphoribosyltransferase-like protein n=1 Tax=Flavobacterium sp. J372 TaxID=2898436 RepID=UPI002151FC90|nr:hypothetical protein [Flavobacterium sp. J372]MCR5863559.1 hypothetical protein [Flavobacterium sp. J372]
MRTALAEKLLIQIMGWTLDEVSTERPLLQSLANFKYNEYQQFSPGIRFVESLVLWLKQFESNEEKRIAYKFFLEELIFISNSEVFHLLSISFPDIINPILIKKAAKQANIDSYHIKKIVGSPEYKKVSKQTLYIGLSDGSKIDQFRRACNINNEQVSSTYQINYEKAQDMLGELNKDSPENNKFNSIFLIDDFTASGISYFRANEKKGKIYKFLKSIYGNPEDETEKEKNLKSILDLNGLEIHILFYIATEESIQLLKEATSQWKTENNLTVDITVQAVQLISGDIKRNIIEKDGFLNILKKYFDDTVIDRHFKMGRHEHPYLGFNECSLPLVLSHNAPNNSLPILWLPDDKKYRGLFPRVSRHKQ